MLRLVSLLAFVTGTLCAASGCSQALAQEETASQPSDELADLANERASRRAVYAAALAEHDAITEQSAEFAGAAIDDARPGCLEGEEEWQRGVDVAFCTTPCVTSDDCLPEDRCTVFPEAVAADGITPLFEVEMEDDTLAAGLCDPFWEELPQHAEDAELVDADE